ncbi:MAG: outer membrane lipoprotein carrier protein LolA [Myxococcota bacterium]|nr:outer membrane lipoprotein carrier protein LolA [Myxococcota bacterium]
MRHRDGSWLRNPVAVLSATAIAVLAVSIPASALGSDDSRGDAAAEVAELPDVESILAELARVPGLSARFREERRLSLLKRPLVTHGSLHFAPPDRLVRRVDAPTASVLLLSGNRLTIEDSRGRKTLDIETLPTLRVFADSFRLILAGKLAELREFYRIRREPAAGQGAWRLRLEPRLPSLAKVISAIEVEGSGRTLREIRISEVAGDSTWIQFSEVDAGRRFSRDEMVQLFLPAAQ